MMDYEASSATVLLPHIGGQLSRSLNNFKDKFTSDEAGITEQISCSSIFDSIEEGCPADIITFHHQEEVVATSHSTTISPLNDLDSIDPNDLFSFFLDDTSVSDPKFPLENERISALPCIFDAPCHTTSSSSLSGDLDIPLDLLDLFDSSMVYSTRHESNSPLALDHLHQGKTRIGSSSPILSEIDEHYHSGDEEYVERALPSRERNQFGSLSNPPLCLHNEDLARGKPGERLVLTSEERRLLTQMGHRVPKTFPLTRSEERAIKTMRRKIRNKISAKASRAKRQEYLSNLESRVADCHKENQRLRGRITELERDKRGLLANLRQLRSHMARLIAGRWPADRNGNSLKKITPSLQPLLPITVPCQDQQQQQHLRMKTSKPASLLILAFMILASATMLPLPGFDLPSHSKDVSTHQSVISGRSRVLLNRDTDVYTLDGKFEDPPNPPISISASLDDTLDDIPVIKTKLRVLNKSSDRVVFHSLEGEEQLDPFLLPTNIKFESANAGQVKNEPDLKPWNQPPVPYSVEDL